MLRYLIRHGAAENVAGRCIGHHDVPLSAEGRATIHRVVDEWRGPPPTRIITSDLTRALDSARVFADGWSIPLDTDARLRELDFGEWEGRTWDALQREDAARLSAWMQDWVHIAPPGGESFETLAARAIGCYHDLGDDTLVVAHAGSIRAILCHTNAAPLARAFDFTVDHAQLHRVTSRSPAAPPRHDRDTDA